MNKEEFVDFFAKEAGISKKEAEVQVNNYNHVLEKALGKASKITFIGHGGYEKKHREERKGRNPQTGEDITIPASNTITFKPGKNFKTLVND